MKMSILIGSARIAVIPDISGFGADLKSKIDAETRSMGDVSIPVKFDVDQASLAAARAALGPLGGQTIPVRFDVDQASAVKAREALGPLAGETVPVEIAVDPASIAKANAEVRAGLGAGGGPQVEVGAKADLPSVVAANAAIKATLDALSPGDTVKLRFDADTGAIAAATVAEVTAAKAAADLANATSNAGAAAGYAGGRFGLLGAQIPLFTRASGLSISVLHLLADSVIEFGAVAVPAFGAAALGLGAFALVATQAGDTAGKVADHLRAVYTVAQATGTEMPMLTHSFNDLTTAIRPQVWGLYGDAIDAVNSQFGSIGKLALATGGVLDTFGARIVVDLKSAGTGFQTFLSAGQRDLVMFGSILATLGNAFSNLVKAAEITHIAEDLLAVAGAAAQLIDWITKIPAPLLAAGLAMHGLYVWGGLAVTAISNLAQPLIALGTRIGAAATMTGSLGDRLITAAGPASLLGKSLGLIGDNPWVAAIAAGVIAVTAFAIWMSRAKDATDQWVEASQKAVQNASIYNLVNTEAAQLVATNQRLATATTNLSNVQGGYFLGMVQGAHDTQELAGNNALLNQQMLSTVTHASNIASTFSTTLPGAYALAAFAGVKVSDMTTTQNKTWDTAMQKIRGVVTGYANMGQGMTQLGNDVSAVSYAASDQLKAITNLNTAWDTFTKNLAAPASTFDTFATDIIKFGTDAQAAGAKAQGLGSGVQGMSKNINSASITLNQDFQSAYTSAEQLFDAMRTSQAPAAQQVKSIKDTVAALIPLAGNSKMAAAQISGLAQEAGGPATTNLQTLQKWAGETGAQGMTALQSDTNKAGTAMSNLSQDAQNLANALQQDLTADMSKAVQAAVGVQGAMDAYTKSVRDNGATTVGTEADRKTLYNDLIAVGETGPEANAIINALSGSIKNNATANQNGQAARETFNSDIAKIISTAPGAGNDVNNLASAVATQGAKSQAAQGARAQLISDLEAAGVKASTATGLVNSLTGALNNLPADKNVAIVMTGTGSYTISAGPQATPGGASQLKPLPSTGGKGQSTPAAAGTLVTGGTPGKDSVLIKATPGELVVPAHLVDEVRPVLGGKIPGFAGGGVVRPRNLDAHQNHVLHLEHLHHQHAEHVRHLEHLHHEHEEHLAHLRHEGKLPRTPAVHHPSGHIAQPHAKPVAHLTAAHKKRTGPDAHQKHVAHVKHLEHLHHEHEQHVAHMRHLKIPGFAQGGLVEAGNTGVLDGSYATSMYNQFQTQFTDAMVKSMQAAIAKAKAAADAAAAAAAAGGGAAGPAGTAGGAVEAQMKSMAAAMGWTGPAWDALYAVEMSEAGFNPRAQNPGSGAYGLAQFINGPSEYAEYGGNSGTVAGQITGMLNYISRRYGDPEAAEAHEAAYHWYGHGGVIPEPVAGIGLRSGDRYRFGEHGPETVTPGTGGAKAGVNINFYGPQYPSPEMQQAMLMKASAMIGVS